MLTLTSRLTPNTAEVAAKVMDGEAIIINLSNGMYYSMDQVGGLVWELIAEERTLDQIISAIVQRYEVTAEQAWADAERVADELLGENLICVSDGQAATAVDQQTGDGQKLPYEPPSLNKYTDMADLLALDPPMPGMQDIPWQRPVGDASARTGG